MLKSKRLAYDGRGNALVTSEGELAAAAASLGGYGHGLYAERLEAFAMELSIMVARCGTWLLDLPSQAAIALTAVQVRYRLLTPRSVA